jgi:NAD+ synthase
MKSPEKIINHIVHWLKVYLEQSGQKGFVVGVSGGIDSAVTSTLCALTQKPVLCLEMPIHQEPSQVSRAQKHIEWLTKNHANVVGKSISLSTVFDTFTDQLPSTEKKEAQHLSLANTRARLRMSTLYYFAALENFLVAGTGNKVEDFGVGFYTKYGDGGVDLSPIADLMKTEVYALGKSLNVIEEIQTAAPTDGLWADHRTDEDQLGARYADLEWAMRAIENKLDPNTFSAHQQKVMTIYKQHHKKSKHKMEPIPVCLIPKSLF